MHDQSRLQFSGTLAWCSVSSCVATELPYQGKRVLKGVVWNSKHLPVQIIGGDLNTLGHGIARFSPYHCTDHLRWATLGHTEAHFWQTNLSDVPEPAEGPIRNERLWAAGVRDDALCRQLTNPGFAEVFPVAAPTLDNPSYHVLGLPLMVG